jgi:hypothetical protein
MMFSFVAMRTVAELAGPVPAVATQASAAAGDPAYRHEREAIVGWTGGTLQKGEPWS